MGFPFKVRVLFPANMVERVRKHGLRRRERDHALGVDQMNGLFLVLVFDLQVVEGMFSLSGGKNSGCSLLKFAKRKPIRPGRALTRSRLPVARSV